MRNRNKANQEIRERIYLNYLRNWEVAKEVGIRAETFSVWLREELDDEKKARVNGAIDRLIKKQEA